MKFRINSRVFKNHMERASVVSDKKSNIAMLYNAEIIADKDAETVKIITQGLHSFAEIVIKDVDVDESGRVTAVTEDIKRLYNIPGILTIESDNGKIRVHGQKKQGVIADTGLEMFEVSYSSDKEMFAFSADKSDLLDTLAKLSVCVADNDVKPTHRGYNISDRFGYIRVSTVNSHTGAIRDTEWKFSPDTYITIPDFVNKELKKVADNKSTEEISVYTDGRKARFAGEDFTYYVDLLQGEFIDLDKVMTFGNSETYSFHIEAEKLRAVAKEYEGLLIKGQKLRYPMYFTFRDDALISAGISETYGATDILDINDTDNIPEDFLYCINSALLNDILTIFGNDAVKIEGAGRIDPWIISGNDGYKSVILPVRPTEDLGKIYALINAA